MNGEMHRPTIQIIEPQNKERRRRNYNEHQQVKWSRKIFSAPEQHQRQDAMRLLLLLPVFFGCFSMLIINKHRFYPLETIISLQFIE